MSERAVRQYQTLPPRVRMKAEKQFSYLIKDARHPSLHAKKYKGYEGVWQARIDQDWRFYFHIIEPHYVIVSIIMRPK